MKRYKIGVVGASTKLGKSILKTIIDNNFPYSFIRALSFEDDDKELKIDDYIFTLNKISINALKELDIIYIVSKVNIDNEIKEFLETNNKIYIIINEDNFNCYENVKKEIFDSLEVNVLEEIHFNCSNELCDNGETVLINQCIDFLNNRPLIATCINKINQNIPLAFNLIPYIDDKILNFYIPSLQGNALYLKIKCSDKDNLINKLKNNEKVKLYDKSLPNILDCEGNSLIHLGIIDNEILTIFITFDYLKIISINSYNYIKARIEND